MTVKTKQTEMDRLIGRYLRHLSNSVSENTKSSYKTDLVVFKDYIEGRGLSITAVTLEHLEDYAEYLKGKYAEATQSRRLQLVKYFFSYLEEIKYITENPAPILRLPKIPKREVVYLDLGEAKRLLKAIDKEQNEFLRLRDKAIILMILNHGLRVEEVERIKLTSIKGKTISVIGKGNKERTLILTDDVITAINEYLEVRFDIDSEYLFLSTRRRPMSKRAMQEMAYKYFNNAGLEGYSIHKLRSTAATLMSDRGVETSDIQEILGHESILTTKLYTSTTTTKKEQVAERMNGLFTS